MPASRAENLLWLLAVATGMALRLYQLSDQILVDDEWHALHALLAGGPLDIFLNFGALTTRLVFTRFPDPPRLS
jgi:hypothetical protein